MKKNINLIMLCDYNSFTGFATVSKNLKDNWKAQFGDLLKIDIVGINYYGEPYTESDGTRVISGKLKDIGNDDFGRHVFMSSVYKNDYDLIFILQDLGQVIPMVKHLKEIKDKKRKENRKTFKSIYYFPVDFSLFHKLGYSLEFFDVLATYTQFGKNEVVRLRPDLKPKIKILPHGNNSKHFYPIDKSEVSKFRNDYFGKNANKFIICNVNRNQPRKDIPATILGFIEYKMEYNNDCLLYLHMNPSDPLGYRLRDVFAQTALVEGEDFMFPNEEDYNKGASLEKLNLIYNSTDVYITTSTGEGWGLTVTEAMACKIPTILPNHTSFSELGANNRTYFLNELYPIVNQSDNVIRFQSDLYNIAKTIHKVFIEKNSTIQTEIIENAYKYTMSLNWKNISASFAEDFKKLS